MNKPLKLSDNVSLLKGVGPKIAAKLAGMGVKTIGDLINKFPLRYEDRRSMEKISRLRDNQSALIKAFVVNKRLVYLRRGKKLVKITVSDYTGVVTLLAFNRPYMMNALKKGEEYFIFGRFVKSKYGLQTSRFTLEPKDGSGKPKTNINRIVPVYSLPQGLSQKRFRKTVFSVFERLKGPLEDFMPERIIRSERLMSLEEAYRNIHFPSSIKMKNEARRRLVFAEFFLFQSALYYKKAITKRSEKKHSYILKRTLLTPFKEKLGFEFTGDQKKAINSIFKDMSSPFPMRRLLQGEVGSGKTAVALSALLLAVENGYQGILIAPTEILAHQHYLTFKSYLKDMGVKTALLKGKMRKSERKNLLRKIKGREIDIIVGTHALLESDVDISYASVCVIDEQHRFGVEQKAVLVGKNKELDVLVMSATPIPRTVALSTYGDLDISTIKKLPPGRKRPLTRFVDDKTAYRFAAGEAKKGYRVYIVHPLISESDKEEWRSAEKRFEKLRKTVFRDFNCELLHGRMDAREKESKMKSFSSGKSRVLFTTTVIEVGVNVPEATVMIVENFNRYGLSTLHQLRGRIARSCRQPHFFLTGKITTEESAKRLDIITKSNDGFEIARKDLALRGAGEIFGTRQKGLMTFKTGDILGDFNIMLDARKYAFESIPGIISDERKLKERIIQEYSGKFQFADVS